MSETEDRLEKLEKLAYQILALGREILTEVAQLTGKEVKVAETPEPEPEPPKAKRPEEFHTVGRFGAVTEAVAITKAEELGAEVGEFNRKQYADKLGLKSSATNQWLTLLIESDVLEYYAGTYTCLLAPPMRDWAVRQTKPFSLPDAAVATQQTKAEALKDIGMLMGRGILQQLEDELFEYVPPPNDAPHSRPRRMPPERERPSYDMAMATGMPVRVAATKRATRRQRSTSGSGGIKGAKQRDARYNKAQAAKEERAQGRQSKAQQQPGFKSRSGKRSRPVT